MLTNAPEQREHMQRKLLVLEHAAVSEHDQPCIVTRHYNNNARHQRCKVSLCTRCRVACARTVLACQPENYDISHGALSLYALRSPVGRAAAGYGTRAQSAQTTVTLQEGALPILFGADLTVCFFLFWFGFVCALFLLIVNDHVFLRGCSTITRCIYCIGTAIGTVQSTESLAVSARSSLQTTSRW